MLERNSIRNITSLLTVLLFFTYGFLHGFTSWFIPLILVLKIGPLITALVLVVTHVLDMVTSLVASYVKSLGVRKILIVLGYVLYLLTYILITLPCFSRNSILLVLSSLLYGSSAIGSISVSLLLLENIPSECSYAISTYCSIFLLLGYGSSSILLAYLYELSRLVIMYIILIVVLISVVGTLLINKILAEKSKDSRKFYRYILDYVKSGFIFWKSNSRLALLISLSALAWSMVSEYLSPYLFEVKHLSILNIGILFTVMVLIGGLIDNVVNSILSLNIQYFQNIITFGSFIGFISWISIIFVSGIFEIIPLTISYCTLRVMLLKGCYLYVVKTSDGEHKITMSNIYHSYTDTIGIIAVGIGGILYSIVRSLPIISASTLQLLALAAVSTL